jgi:hypothetical protein
MHPGWNRGSVNIDQYKKNVQLMEHTRNGAVIRHAGVEMA